MCPALGGVASLLLTATGSGMEGAISKWADVARGLNECEMLLDHAAFTLVLTDLLNTVVISRMERGWVCTRGAMYSNAPSYL